MSGRYGKRSDSWLVVTVLGLAVVLGGLVYAFWDKIKGLGRPAVEMVEEPPPPPRRPARRVEPPKIERAKAVVARKPPPPPVKPRPFVSDSRKQRAAELHRQAEAALRALDFDLAAELFGKEADLLRRDPEAASRARALCAKVETFGKITSGVKPNPEAAGDMATILLHSGGRIPDVTLLDERDDAYVIARKGMRVEIRRDRVSGIERMSPETQRQRLESAFAKVESSTTERTGAAYAALAKEALRGRLNDKALEYLEKAYSADGRDLPKKIRIRDAKKMLGRAIWCASTGRTKSGEIWCRKVERLFTDLPGMVAEARELRERMAKPVAVANYRSTVKITTRPKRKPRPNTAASPQEEVVTVDTTTVSSRSGRNSKTVGQINTLFKQGMDHYVAGRPGNPNSNMHLGKAAKFFDQVTQLCDQALRNDPGNAQLQSRQTDATRYAYNARKMKTLSLFGG